MSDIYLQITETPTVVTLSAPVVSGALASTVTVANTVTVALDSNSLSALENVTVTVGAAITGTVTVSNFPASVTVGNTVTIAGTVTANGGDFASPPLGAYPAKALRIGFADDEQYNAVGIASGGKPLPITLYDNQQNILGGTSNGMIPLAISGTVTVGSALPAGTNRIGVVTIGGGTVTLGTSTAQIGSVTASISGGVTANLFVRDINNTPNAVGVNFKLPVVLSDLDSAIGSVSFVSALQDGGGQVFGLDRNFPINGSVTLGAGTAQIGSVTASISGTVPVSGTFFQATQPVSLTTLPALVAGTAQIGSVTASISNSVVTFYPMQGTSVSNTNFTSTTASTTLVSAVANREVLTVFNEGAGNLHISPGATCTTISYQVRLSSGDYWECPQGQLSLAHTAVFATAGTARVTQVS